MKRPSLPLQLTSFVGRTREIEALCSLLESTRLLTITGAGGSGKTRLALEVGARVTGYPDGVDWVELAPLVDPGYLTAHIATVLGIREDAAPSPEEALVGTLRDQVRLLVLDNCEHVVDACAPLIELLLRSCPRVTVVATSREALGVSGERTWLVPSLSLPPLDEVPSADGASRFEAVRLFAERARDVVSDFEVTDANAAAIVRICRRVDGLPLAVELAAARVRVLPPDQIASRLEDSFRVLAVAGRGALPRHRTLRAAIDWSYDLLTGAERELLGRLAVFSGGFSLEAAERVCAGHPIGELDVLDLLTELVDKSLVAMQEKAGVARYHLLESVREYASERLGETDSAATARVQRRHAEFFRDFAAAAEAHAIVGESAWLDRLDADADNCRAALAWSHALGHDSDVGLPLASALIWYWYHRNRWREGSQALELALQGSPDAPPTARARALHGTGIFANYVGELAFADARLSDAEAIWRSVIPSEPKASPVIPSGAAKRRSRGIETVEVAGPLGWDDLDSSTRVRLARNDTGSAAARWLAFALIGRSTVALATNRPDDAERFAEESLRVARLTGDPWDAALAGGYALMAVKVWRQDWPSADLLLADAGHVFRSRGYVYGLAFVLDARAYVALQLGEDQRSAALAVDAIELLSDRPDHWLASRSARVVSAIAARGDQAEWAAQLLGAADGMLASIGARALTSERAGLATLESSIRATLPVTDFDRAYQAGTSMPFREATALARRYGAVLASTDRDVSSLGTSSTDVRRRPHAVALEAASTDDTSAPALEARTLGRLELLRNGTPIPPEAWRYAKPRELLLYLLVHHSGRTRDQLGVVFWPEASAAQVKNNFHVTLHQVRRALGTADLVVFDGERYVINWSLGVVVDARRFEEEARGAMRMREGALEPLGRALARYGGDFLEDANVGDWHLEHRERLQRLYVDGLLVLGELLARAGRSEDEAEAYRRILARDAVHEEAHRRLIVSLARAGRRSDALKQFDRLASVLDRELDAEPDPATISLVERVRRGAPI